MGGDEGCTRIQVRSVCSKALLDCQATVLHDMAPHIDR
jgi:hypothetical protein